MKINAFMSATALAALLGAAAQAQVLGGAGDIAGDADLGGAVQGDLRADTDAEVDANGIIATSRNRVIETRDRVRSTDVDVDASANADADASADNSSLRAGGRAGAGASTEIDPED